MHMKEWVILERIHQLIVVMNVATKGSLNQLQKDLNVQFVKIEIRKLVMSLKELAVILGNPQARPMVHGRHQEIKSRVKHLSNERNLRN